MPGWVIAVLTEPVGERRRLFFAVGFADQ